MAKKAAASSKSNVEVKPMKDSMAKNLGDHMGVVVKPAAKVSGAKKGK